MSRIGRKVIIIPAGVTVNEKDGVVTVSGPKGTLTQIVENCVKVEVKGNEINTLIAKSDDATANAKQGLYRSLVANMVKGVSEGWTKTLLISGVGYKAILNGKVLNLNLGFSHKIDVKIEDGIEVKCPSVTEIVISGIDKQKVGQFASNIKALRPVEPYHGYGVRYNDQVVIRKVGKTAGKGKK